jgi:hypothetical protein
VTNFPSLHQPSQPLRLSLALLLWALSAPLSANVFGDGNPHNGTEDDRTALERASDSSGLNPGWPMSAGTLFCDGKTRGSATLVQPATAPEGLGGLFIATAAHVLFDLEEGGLWNACSFHFMGLGAVAGYRAPLDLRWVRRGRFVPAAERSGPRFGQQDWAFAWLPEAWPYAAASGLAPARLPVMAAAELAGQAGATLSFELVAWNPQAGNMSISRPCQAVASIPEDIGGGHWPGQLLDDCDSGSGASGGGLVAVLGDVRYLVGVRSGSHWDPAQYPEGPPAGARWDVASNTNFARAMDPELGQELAALVADVMRYLQTVTTP